MSTSVVLLLGLKCDEYSVYCQIRLAKNLADDEERTLGGQDKWIIKMCCLLINKIKLPIISLERCPVKNIEIN